MSDPNSPGTPQAPRPVVQPPQAPRPVAPHPPQQVPHVAHPATPQPATPQAPRPVAPQAPRPAAPAPPGLTKIAPVPVTHTKPVDLEPISLVDEPASTSGVSKIKAFQVGGAGPGTHEWKRQPHANGTGAIRVKTFHGRLSDEGMAFIDDKINEFLDSHPDIEVKFATTNIGVFEGKIREPALIVNVWY